MVPTGLPSRPYGNDASAQDDLPAQAAAWVETVVGAIRDKTARPAQFVARALVYGTFAVVVSISAVVVFIIAAVRILDNYLPSSVFGDDHTWVAYLFLGLAFTIAGWMLWRRRR